MYEILHDERDRAPLKPRNPGKICSRNRLTRPDEIEHEVAIYLSGCFIRRAQFSGEGKGVRRCWRGHRSIFCAGIPLEAAEYPPVSAGG